MKSYEKTFIFYLYPCPSHKGIKFLQFTLVFVKNSKILQKKKLFIIKILLFAFTLP